PRTIQRQTRSKPRSDQGRDDPILAREAMLGRRQPPRLAEQNVVRRMDDAVRRALRPATVRAELPRLTIVVETGTQQAAQADVKRRILHGSHRLDPAVEIALHPVRRANVELLGPSIGEAEHSRVLEKASDDADDANSVAQHPHAGPQAAD